MAIVLPEWEGKPLGVFDPETSKGLNIKKVVEITDECSFKEIGSRGILFYTKATQGLMIQISSWYPGKEYGPFVSFFMNKTHFRVTDSQFIFEASCLGIQPERLYELAVSNKPV